MIKTLIKDFLRFSPRQALNGQRTARFIKNYFENLGIEAKYEKFQTTVPIITKESLEIDGKKIECRGVSFVGGKITGKSSICASTIPSRYLLLKENINFNPYSDDGVICRNNFYFAPALAVKNSDLMKVVNAESIKGEVKVKKWTGEIRNVLVGNAKNPKSIIFAHYDSLGTGAIDNASGVAVCMDAIAKNPGILKNTLFVFDGNEELSYDQPTYWGHGFRVFEKRHSKMFDKAEKIIPIDSIGNGKTIVNQNPVIVNLAFPLADRDRWAKKIFTIHGDIHELMSVYHSDNDTLKDVSEKYLVEAYKVLTRLIT